MHRLRRILWEGGGLGDFTGLEIICDDIIAAIKFNVLLIAAVFATLFIAYKVMLYMADVSSKLDPFVIIRPCLLLGCIVLYEPLVELLLFTPTDFLGEIVRDAMNLNTADQLKTFGQEFIGNMTFVPLATASTAAILAGTAAGTAAGAGVFAILALSSGLELFHLFLTFAASAVGMYILVRQVIVMSVYYILGVFAIPLSLIAGNQSVFASWFFGFLSVLLWLPVLNVLMYIIKEIQLDQLIFTNALFSIGMQIAFIGLILQVPKYANMLVSKGSEATQGGGAIGAVAGGAAFGAKAALTKKISKS